MRHNDKLLAVPLILLAASTASSRGLTLQQSPETPTFRVEVRGDLATEFITRVSSYFELRRELEQGLPLVTVAANPAENSRAVLALATAVRKARRGTKEGDIFTPAVSVELKRALRAEMNASSWAAITDDNPGASPTRINSSYPDRKRVSTLSPNILAILPPLPENIEYRFLGRHLILLDTRASLIIDRMPNAFRDGSRLPWWQRALGAFIDELGRGSGDFNRRHQSPSLNASVFNTQMSGDARCLPSDSGR
jgi:hypothetical protein